MRLKTRYNRLSVVPGVCLAVVLLMPQGAHSQTNASSFPEFKPQSAFQYLENVSTNLLREVGTNSETLFLQGKVASVSGDKQGAEQLLKRAFELTPTRAEIQVVLSDLFVREDRLDDALASLKTAEKLSPGFPGLYRKLGMVQDRLGDRAGAKGSFEKAVKTAPRDATARLLLGRLLLDLGEAPQAATMLEEACRLDPKSANAFYALSQALTRTGKEEAAAKALEQFKALKAEENAQLAQQNAAYNNEKEMRETATTFHLEAAAYLAATGKDGLAEQHFKQARVTDPQNAEALEKLALFYLERSRFQEARTAYEQLIRQRPKDVVSAVNYGSVLMQLRDYAAAVNEFKRILEINPRQPEALNNLARYYLGNKKEQATALTLSKRLVEVDGRAASYDLLGWAYYANGLTNDALAASEQSVNKDPGNPVYQERLRRLRQALGMPAK